MDEIMGLNKNLRKIDPIKKLKNGEIVLRDGNSKFYTFGFLETENEALKD